MFNTTTEVELPGYEPMTIDELLVFMPQLNEEKDKLRAMKHTPSCKSIGVPVGGGEVEYIFANFDPEQVGNEYDDTVELLSQAQLAQDRINQSQEFEVPITE